MRSEEMHERQRGMGELLRDLARGGADMLRAEARLARLELAQVGMSAGRGVALVATGGVLLLLGALSLAAGLLLLIGDQWIAGDRYWLGALIVLLITAGLASWMVRRGLARLSPARLMPNETVETLKEDKEWLKRQLRSGATSS